MLLIALPFLLFWIANALAAGFWRWILVIAGLLVSIPTMFIVMIESVDLVDVIREGVDTSYELFAENKVNGVDYRLYRTNGGATTSYGVVLQKERVVISGLKLITKLQTFYPAKNATFETLPSGKVRVLVEAYDDKSPAQFFEFNP